MPINAFIHLHNYSDNHLYVNEEGVHIPVTYQKTWDDGFGARGWKIDVSIGDPTIIASTRETGTKIPTSVRGFCFSPKNRNLEPYSRHA